MAPIKYAPKCITTSIVDAVRVVRIIKIKDANPLLFSTWARKVFLYIERLPVSTIHIVFGNYNCEDDTFLNPSKGRLTSSAKRRICSLNLVLLNHSEWSEFLSNSKNKFQLCNLLADFTSEHIVTNKKLFVTKEKLCDRKLPNT